MTYSQEKKAIKLPEVLISQNKKYIPDNNPDAVVRNTQNEFVLYKVDDECKNFSEYLVTLENKKGSLQATFDEKGVLMYVSEKYTNVELPREVINSVYMSYPDWTITKSKFEYSQQKGEILKKSYHLKLKKNNKTQIVIINSTGEIIKNTKDLAMN
ncbi:hypothetical protein FEM08_33600 [Flavobacterium gilvum]|nr:hypothetical protein FEM08_33600 [Flavobacterium gilvum]